MTLSQLALAWLLARKSYSVPIPGSRNADRVAENVAAADIVLTKDDPANIEAIALRGAKAVAPDCPGASCIVASALRQ